MKESALLNCSESDTFLMNYNTKYTGIGKLIEMHKKTTKRGQIKMNIIYATYNIHHNSIDV